eukprot:TRINITY_DN3171_c0_g1_i5.p1 TRINITY_DN3171_c0_g1~~TRINITY_DN3171_c0_g1_i5.p1  ORF type:complete len:478 (-),score=78.65 TRINITY_DN3171_c0_g1_i5:457-1890(-)
MLSVLRRYNPNIARTLSVTYNINVRHYEGRHINYYDVLGVRQHADTKEIKMAYFKMAKKFHPDFNKTLDARQMFELIAEAYEVLSDEERKKEYDETGCVSHRHGGRASDGPGRQSTDKMYTAEQMYTKIFNTKEDTGHDFQEESAHIDFAASLKGASISKEMIISLSFEESVRGRTVVVPLRVIDTCDKCDGSRSEMGYQGKICPYCEGTGEETIKTGHIIGRKECSYCHGEKIFIRYKCIECEGIGKKLYRMPYNLTIPPGTEHGQVLRFILDPKSLGLTEQNSPERILYVTIKVKDSPFFERDGMDLSSFIRLSPSISLLGGKLEYEGPTVSCDLEVQPCTSSHTTLLVNSGGVHSFDYAGDHLLKTLIKVPKKLTWRQRRKLAAYAALEGDATSGTIDGVTGEMDHKYQLNLVHPSKVENPMLAKCLFNEEKLNFSQRIMQKILAVHKYYLWITDPSYREAAEADERGHRSVYG